MITANDLIAQCEIPLEEKWGYIWGASGQTWTQANQDAATDATIREYGQQWVGRRVCDCSGLIYWAMGQLGGSVHHGSNSIWNYDVVNATKGELKDGKRTDGKAIRPGSCVFLTTNQDGHKSRHHVGLYIGSNMCVEAKGTRSGVVASALSHWDEVAELKDVSYDGEAVLMTLRKGCRGDEVKELQTELIRQGYDCGTADGIFGSRTETAVKAYQRDMGLAADGVVGPKTWEALGVRIEEAMGDTGNEDPFRPSGAPSPEGTAMDAGAAEVPPLEVVRDLLDKAAELLARVTEILDGMGRG